MGKRKVHPRHQTPEPIFVKTRTHYYDCGDTECMKTHSNSYTDFWKLVELAEFSTVYLDEIDYSSNDTYICSPINGEYPDSFPQDRKCRLIHWQLERPSEGLICDSRFDETWVSDRYFASILPGSKYVTLGTDWRLSHPQVPLFPKKWDFIHLSYLTDRRKRVVDYLLEQNMSIAPNGWGIERHVSLKQSKAMLAIHQDDQPVIEPLRYAIASAYALPILAEESKDYYPWVINQPFQQLGLVWLHPKNPTDEDYQFKKLIMEAL